MNFDKYIGLPYQENGRTLEGVDCWGLARLLYKQELNIELPDYSDLYTGSWDEQVTKLINAHKDTWKQVAEGKPGDLCLFNIYGEPAHVGVYIGENKFLHSRERMDVAVESLTSPVWSKRFAGFYEYVPNAESVSITGAPHPLKLAKHTDEIPANSTLQDVIEFVNKKYEISGSLTKRIVLMLDGVPIPSEQWATTTIKEGQNIAYRVLAQGQGTGRLIVAFAVFIAVTAALGDPNSASSLAANIAGGAGKAAVAVKAGLTLAAMTATAYLQNVISPIRPPDAGKDPGQPNQLNLFNGSSNQINRLGAIPVILGKVRYTGLLGATPFIETHTNTNILNLLVIWGFGPLYVDPKSISVGASNLEQTFYDGSEVSVEDSGPPVRTLMGLASETNAQREQFNKLYPTDVEQIFKNVELTNNPTDGNDWVETEFLQAGTRVDIVFSFPEGMRSIKAKGNGAGEIGESTCAVEIQVVPVGQAFEDTAAINPGGGSITTTAYSDSLTVQPIEGTQVYRWYDLCAGPGGTIQAFAGTPTLNPDQDPDATVIKYYNDNSYSYLVGNTASYTRFPVIPAGYYRLYRICLVSGSGLIPERTVNYLQTGFVGLTFSYENKTIPGLDEALTPVPTGVVQVSITGGKYYPDAAPVNGAPTTQSIFKTSPQSVTNTNSVTNSSGWHQFLNQNGIWSGNVTELNRTVQVTLLKSGVYDFIGAADDEAVITMGGQEILNIPKGGYKSTTTSSSYFNAGTYSLNILAKNSGGGAAGVAFEITYTSNAGANTPASPKTIFTFGTNGVFSRRKDAFNYVYSIKDLPRAKYKLRVRRADPEIIETSESEYRHFNKAVLSNVLSFDNKLPINELPRGRLAKTAIKVQSNAKNNGQVDGINAVVQTIFWDWDRDSNDWVYRATNNPASLFAYVLTHPANAYRLADVDAPNFGAIVSTKIDLPKLIEWHNFCNPAVPTANNPTLTYNAVLTSTQSIMDTLRDICAAGKASPIFIDGKWSVVIDKPRNHVIQHFTPHNSWGFEATKTLPRLPHAFRTTIQDEENAYQPKEIYVYNYGYYEYTGYIVAATNFVAGRNYTITDLGNTTQTQWNTVAGTTGATYTKGTTFTATGAGVGTGKAYTSQGTSGTAVKGAEIFEELNFPGVTNEAQATHLARWHMAQLKLRPETYTLNTDFEYLVCNRGDLVRVTHDVPMWGLASGRIKSVNYNAKTIELTESVLLETTKSYRILVRNNNISTTAGSGSVYKNLVAVGTTGYYTTITVQESITQQELEPDNLFMLGELNKETQELIVLSVEPANNLSARITLTDYSPQIYSSDLSSELIYYSNITAPTTGVVENTIVSAPDITEVLSTRETREIIGTGVYQTTALLTFSNATGLTKFAEQVQLELVRGNETFSANNPSTLYFTKKESVNYTFTGLETGIIYKVRARYCNTGSTVFGPWSNTFTFVAGPAGIEPPTPTLVLDLDGTDIVAQVPQTVVKQPDFLTFEYRLYKDTGVEDFWNLTPDNTNNIKVIQSTTSARFNLLNMPTPRMSQAGITYRVACRTVNRNNEYSAQSALGTIVVTTIT